VTLVPAPRDERTLTVPPRLRALAQPFQSAAWRDVRLVESDAVVRNADLQPAAV
jgi:hypothetical protein